MFEPSNAAVDSTTSPASVTGRYRGDPGGPTNVSVMSLPG
jgi:hypothetical protein